MKKTLIAMAVLAAAGAASAQSSVTLFGIVDAAVTYGKSDTNNVTRLIGSGYNTSRLGFRGVEDLGGGLSASFWLEMGIDNDTGSGQATNTNNRPVGAFVPATGANAPVRAGTQGLTFGRRSTVSLAGGFGEVRLGRDYTPHFWNLTVFDPFGTTGVGGSQVSSSRAGGETSVRASNSIGYFLPPKLGGIYGQVQYYLGENLSNATTNQDEGRGFSARVGYAAGPLNVAIAYGKTDVAVSDITTANLGASYDFGMAKVMGMYQIDEVGATGADQKGWLLGVSAPVGAGEIRAAYSQSTTDAAGADPRARKIALGYVHNLSKRTAVYTTYARVKNSNGANQVLNGATGLANGDSSGLDIGVRHAF